MINDLVFNLIGPASAKIYSYRESADGRYEVGFTLEGEWIICSKTDNLPDANRKVSKFNDEVLH